MPLRDVPHTRLSLPELSFGAASLGNLYRSLDDTTAHHALEAGLAGGLRYVDTAPYYGFGLSERRVGDVVRGRADIVLSTKVGRLLKPAADIRCDHERHGFRSAMPFEPVYDYTRSGILRSFEMSLQRLGVARIDILYVHDIGRLTHGAEHAHYFAQLTKGGGFAALEELRAAGDIAAFGLGVNEAEVCIEAMEHSRLDLILLAGRYTLLEQDALHTLFPACATAGTRIIVGGVYNSGILATGTKAGQSPHYDYQPAPGKVVERVRAIEDCCHEHAVRLPAAALQFPLAHPLVASVLVGLGNAKRVAETLALRAEAIPAAFWADLIAKGLLDSDAPLPTGER